MPFFGLERCGDKCRPEQKPEVRSGFQTNKIESVDAVVCCQGWGLRHTAGKGQAHGLSPQTLPDAGFCGKRFVPFLGLLLSVVVSPHLLLRHQNYLLKARGSVSEPVLRGDGVSCAQWNWSLSGSCLHL